MSRSRYYSVRMRASANGKHISGAEGLCKKEDIKGILHEYAARALSHERGKPDEVRISIDKIVLPVKGISSLPLCTVRTLNTASARKTACDILRSSGISAKAIDAAFSLITEREPSAGAFILDTGGKILLNEPGVRVTKIGITENASSVLKEKLSLIGINNQRVKEALILASKVKRRKEVVAELCVSDDPGYTTGYVTADGFGYVRIPHIKRRSFAFGGRVFFVNVKDISGLLEYLKNQPVMISRISECRGVLPPRDLMNSKL